MKQKHNHKKIFPACALLAAAGLALTAAGVLLGGWVYGIQFDTQGIRVYAPLLEQESGRQDMVAKEEKLEPFGEIAVSMECADVRIQASDSDDYVLSYCLDQTGGLKKEVKDGRLVLEDEPVSAEGLENLKTMWFSIGSAGQAAKQPVTIYVPAKAKLSDVTIQTESGDVSCESIQADRLAIASSYGSADIRLPENISDYAYQLKTDSGRIYIEGKDMGISCASVNGEAAGKITAVCKEGDIRIQ